MFRQTMRTSLHSFLSSTKFTMSATLPSTIRQGILGLPQSAEAKATVERLLEEDRQTHHCFFGKVGFHNHLSHHLLAAYDFGAPAKLLQAIYDEKGNNLSPINLADRKTGAVEEQHTIITAQNWTEFLGQEKHYAGYVKFFTDEVKNLGSGQTLEQYIFSPAANGNGSLMLLRFVGGAVHPMIQTGYGIEFGSDAMVAQAMAQTAVHTPFVPELFDLEPSNAPVKEETAITEAAIAHRQPSKGRSLLSILREAYDSPILHPVMPYDPDALLTKRRIDACKDGRPEEIRRLSALWQVDTSQKELDEKVEELFWTTTLLMAGTGKPGRKPRLDFFLMHMLNVTLFVPSLLKAIPNAESKATLLRATVPVMLIYLIIRGRPRINPELLMSYTATPRPPLAPPQTDTSAIGDPREAEYVNPVPGIIASVLYSPDAHTVKAIRALIYAAKRYGTTPAGGALGAFQPNGEETHKGMSKVDGTLFLRAAGVVMDTLGWVSYGQKEGQWDRSGLGWDDAWKNDD